MGRRDGKPYYTDEHMRDGAEYSVCFFNMNADELYTLWEMHGLMSSYLEEDNTSSSETKARQQAFLDRVDAEIQRTIRKDLTGEE